MYFFLMKYGCQRTILVERYSQSTSLLATPILPRIEKREIFENTKTRQIKCTTDGSRPYGAAEF